MRTRRATLATLAGLVGLAALGACAPWPEPAVAVQQAARVRDRPEDQDLAALVPAGAETVIEVDLATLRRSAFTAEALRNPDERVRDRSAAALGTDAAADADRIVYATGGAGAGAPTLVIAEGRFQTANVEAAFRERWPGVTTDTWHGIPVLASGENALASLSPRTFISGAPGQVRAAVDRAFGVGLDFREAAGPGAGAGGDPGDGQGVVRRDLLGVVGAPGPAVLVTMSIGETVRARVGDAFPLPRELRTLGLRLDAGETLDLHALGILKDRDAARDLARRLGVLLGARDTRRALEAIGLGPLLERAKVTVDGARVRLVASVAAEHRTATAEALRSIVGALRTGGDPRAGGSW